MIWVKQYSNYNTLFRDLLLDIKASLPEVIKTDECRELIVQGIDEGLGAPGSGPNSYKRRGRNGGLTDPNLISVGSAHLGKSSDGSYEVRVFTNSIAEGNGAYRGGLNPVSHEKKVNTYVPPVADRFYVGAIVQTGIGYSWKNSRYYNPLQSPGNGRPIYEKAGEKLSANGQLASMISAELARRGW